MSLCRSHEAEILAIEKEIAATGDDDEIRSLEEEIRAAELECQAECR